MKQISIKPTLSKLLGYLQIFIGAGAIAGGLQLIFVPDGSAMDMSTEILSNSPFSNFLIPGITLFTVIGLGNILGAWLSLKKFKLAGIYGTIMGATLIIWMLVQIVIIGWGSWLQPFYITMGTLELILGFILFRRMKIQYN